MTMTNYEQPTTCSSFCVSRICCTKAPCSVPPDSTAATFFRKTNKFQYLLEFSSHLNFRVRLQRHHRIFRSFLDQELFAVVVVGVVIVQDDIGHLDYDDDRDDDFDNDDGDDRDDDVDDVNTTLAVVGRVCSSITATCLSLVINKQ